MTDGSTYTSRLGRRAIMVTMPSAHDLRRAVRSIRAIIEKTTDLPDDSPRSAQLRDRLSLAADVLDAAADGAAIQESARVPR